MENVTGHLRTINRMELDHLQQVFDLFEEVDRAGRHLSPPLRTQEMRELNFKDTKVLDFRLKGGQDIDIYSENLTMVGMDFSWVAGAKPLTWATGTTLSRA
jgi:hypothetical protein